MTISSIRVRALVVCLGLLCVVGCSEQAPESAGGPVAMRRLTETQYRQTVADIFGADIQIFGRFEPDYRREGLLSVGSAWSSITASGFEQYAAMARGIARQIMDAEHRSQFLSCTPVADSAVDEACTANFVRNIGRKLFRRPLLDSEWQSRVEIASQAAASSGSFYKGLEYAVASLMTSPEFLFRIESAAVNPDSTGQLVLDAYSKAARLSYLLWNTTPDESLLKAAESGELDTRRGLAKQVDRLLNSPRLDAGVRAFFADMLRFDELDEVSKDTTIYPAFNARLAEDAEEQTLRSIVDYLISKDGDYRGLFVMRNLPMTRRLGVIYGVPVTVADGWENYEYSPQDARAGLLSQVSFLAQHAHPGGSSPTLRGKFIREVFMCQTVPPPPADVDFTMDASFDVLKTSRQRLERHRSEPACSGCHTLMDPIGLTLEQFDGVGAYRTRENGEIIDVSGSLDGVDFEGATGLGRALYENSAVPACLIDTLYSYAAGRGPVSAEREFVSYLESNFATSEYKFRTLLRLLVTSHAFYAIDNSVGVEK